MADRDFAAVAAEDAKWCETESTKGFDSKMDEEVLLVEQLFVARNSTGGLYHPLLGRHLRDWADRKGNC